MSRNDAWWREIEANVQRQQQAYNSEPRPYHLNQLQQPPGYSPLSEADVQRIADAVVARLKVNAPPLAAETPE